MKRPLTKNYDLVMSMSRWMSTISAVCTHYVMDFSVNRWCNSCRVEVAGQTIAASQNLKVDRGKWAPHVSHPTTSWPPSAEMSSSLWSDLSAESEQAPAGKDVE